MTNLQKEEKFLQASTEQEDKATISPVGNQSVKIELPCGCSQVQHMACGDSKMNLLTNRPYNEESSSKRFQWIELCEVHKNE